jgi:hypothetical protein
MSSATTIAIVASTVIAAAGAAYSGYAASEAADEQAALQEKQAAMEAAAAQSEADKIREKGRRVAATQEAALAGSGVKLDDQGSGGALLSETKRLTEQDALAAIAGGNNRATLLKDEAGISRSRGNAALVSGALNTASTLIGGVNAYQKSTQNTKLADKINLSTGSTYTSTKPKYTLLG